MGSTRVVLDRTREPWTVEEMSTRDGKTVLRYRHEMGYELAAVVDRPLERMSSRTLKRLLEDVRHRKPGSVADAA